MKTIKIDFIDFHRNFDKENNDFTNILRERYNVVISKNPDYIFYSSFGKNYLKYDCIRIFYTGECITPDFNHCDYAMAFDRLLIGDRYLRLPLYRIFKYRQFYDRLFTPQRNIIDAEEREFCDFVYSNCFADDIRERLFKSLSEYKRVDSGGRYLNNVGGAIADKFDFQKRHKFSITIENGSYPGYSTEKIVEALAAGSIPIYIGDPDIANDFNENAFINGNRYSSIEEIVERVKEIDSNDELYNKMRAENAVIEDKRNNDDLREFLFAIFDQELERAKRRPNTRFALEEESHYKRYKLIDECIFQKIARVKRILVRIKKGALK